MSLYTQQNGINAARAHLDDSYDGKTVFQFSPLQGAQDGVNKIFQIPQSRVSLFPSIGVPTIFPLIFKNGAELAYSTDYTLTNPKQGIITFTTAPDVADSLLTTFSWTWFDDIEWDHHLNRAANEIGFTQYYVTSSGVLGTETLPAGGSLPTDIPDGLFNAITLLAGSFAAQALSLRFAQKYDLSAGDQSFSPSQMAERFDGIREKLEKRALKARDDFYKAQGRQYRPTTAQTGFVLPSWSPKR